MPNFRELDVWKRAVGFTTLVYRATRDFPEAEVFGLTSQMRRAALSIPLNVAEGAGSGSDPEYRRFVQIALRSTYEVLTAIEIALNLDYLIKKSAVELAEEANEIAALLGGLIRHLSKSTRRLKA